jgi:kinesin family protein 4/21/27
VSLLEVSNAELQRELQERRLTCEHLNQRAVDAQVIKFLCFCNYYALCDFFSLITIESIIQVEKDKLIMQIESARNGKSWDEIDSSINQVWVN